MIQKLVLGGQRKPVEGDFRSMTRAEILGLRAGERVWFVANDGKARQLTITGRIRTWKRDSERVEVPIKYGLYEYACFDLPTALKRLLKPVTLGEGERWI